MNKTADSRALLWGLLALWVGVELLFSSHWWPPGARPKASASPAPGTQTLRHLLERKPSARVWFAPYTTFPETGFVESTARRGVYDTLLAIPTDSGTASNYGASKLSPADSLFTIASVHGLAAELRLAQKLGYGFFALDVGAVIDSAAASNLCKRSAGCQLSSDAYALFAIPANTKPLETSLTPLQRRIPQLPWKSAGPSWGSLVFSPFQWSNPSLRDGTKQTGVPRFAVQGLALPKLEIYRHPLSQFPAVERPRLELSDQDVRVRLAPGVQKAELCIGKAPQRFRLRATPCSPVQLGASRRSFAISDLIRPGEVTQIAIKSLEGSYSGPGPLSIEVD